MRSSSCWLKLEVCRMKIDLACEWCGKPISRYPSKVKAHNFCCRECQAHFSNKTDNPEGYAYRDFSKNSARFTEMNKALNPTRMTQRTRLKLRAAHLGTGSGKSYEKIIGRHKHRVVAELMLGRKLKPGEVVHHIDGNRRNNSPENLMVFPSQAEHARWHNRGGDAR